MRGRGTGAAVPLRAGIAVKAGAAVKARQKGIEHGVHVIGDF
jgi:hypothetical protein